MGWWLNLTAPPRPSGIVPIGERERIRKAELTSYSILAVFIFLFMLVSNSLADASTGQAVGTMAFGLIIVALLNRAGKTRIAAYLIPTLLMVLTMVAILQAKGGLRLVWLPAYDLLVLPIFLTSLTADRRAPWIFAVITVSFIIGDFALQPHALITADGAQNFDDIKHEISIFTWWGMVNRHVALALFAAFFGWLGARSVDFAIRRADRAEELAHLEHAIAEQRRQLEIGAQQLLETHVRVANGDYTARAPLSQDNMLWQVAASLNNLVTRIQRAGDAEFKLRRTEEEMMRVVAAIDDANGGRRPLWPAPTGTVVDELLRRVASGQRVRQPAGPPPGLRPPTPAPPQSQSFAQPSSYPPGMGPMAPAYPAQSGFAPQMPVTGSLGGDNGWPSLSTGGGHASLATDNPWVLPADE